MVAGAALLEEGGWGSGNVCRSENEVMIWRTQDDPSGPSHVSSRSQPRPGLSSSGPRSRKVAIWRAEAVRVHARFHGRPGTFAQFGDSITETLAFWAPLKHARKNAPPRMEHAFRIGRRVPASGMLAGLERPGIRQSRRPDDPLGRGKCRGLARAA